MVNEIYVNQVIGRSLGVELESEIDKFWSEERKKTVVSQNRRRAGLQSVWQRRVCFRDSIDLDPRAWCREGERVGPRHLRYWAIGLRRGLSNLLLDVQSFVERGWQGWSQKDTWNVDHYLVIVVPGLLRTLLNLGCSYSPHIDPKDVPLPDDGEEDRGDLANRGPLRWERLINTIIAGFESMERIGDLHLVGEELQREEESFERGMFLFTKYYRTFWD